MTHDPDLHYHYTSAGGHTLTHTHPGGRFDHEGRHPEHRSNDRGAYYSHRGPAPRLVAVLHPSGAPRAPRGATARQKTPDTGGAGRHLASPAAPGGGAFGYIKAMVQAANEPPPTR